MYYNVKEVIKVPDKKNISFYLSEKEEKIMKILWNSDKPLSAKEIAGEVNCDWADKSIQGIIKKLESKKAIEVADIVKVYKSNARLFKPTISSDEYAVMQFDKFYNHDEKIPFILSALVENKNDDTNLPEILMDLIKNFKEK